MKRKLRVVQINGFRGIILALFVICCLLAGFIAFPAFAIMNLWNYFAAKIGSLLFINFGEGLLLWGIIALSFYIFNKKSFIISFKAKHELTEDEMKKVISKIKSQSLNKTLSDSNANEEIEVQTKNDN